ncbi:non-canonical purine NTP pyrophosphatase [Neoaquamicrobium sediminum]|uniref:non-canonical purine NTP pyrophosphatase n=1 Tax=Neoaquamicrobium sediminum TaxID=1849104 RepID=UPI0015651E60|nr:non-canonical purine NTP pyrophosphatase [Mesorhizobium sediminum]MBX9452898.1 non-canonical purine NTP pyrophosphatase [Mesorhizobium sp.]MBX9463790.1 non-canonical purine NTP pyrophosphatase [Aquamicrobium sp.]
MRKLEAAKIVVASHNKGKLAEIAELIAPFGLQAGSAADYGLPEPAETGTTFEENAYIKAYAAASATGLPALSDDSGLVVDALDGAPGVYTADWAETGDGRDFAMAMRKVEDLLREKGAVTPDARTGRFVAVLCLCWPDGHAEYFRGEVEGTLVWPPRGERGFGYDPVFKPDGYDETFGEMPASQKHSWEAGRGDLGLSHRARAFARFANAMLVEA